MPLTPKLEDEHLAMLPTLLRNTLHLKPADDCTVTPLGEHEHAVTVRAGGVTSVFTVDSYTLRFRLNEAESYDLFSDTESYTDIGSRPIESAAEIHEQRAVALTAALQELEDPTLIEE